MYDFTVASKRLSKLVDETKKLFKCYGITKVLLAGTGDFINSDRRLAEKLASATSQVRASLLATYLIQQVIIDLARILVFLWLWLSEMSQELEMMILKVQMC